MASSERSLDDYVDVAQRIADFRELYPSGSLQPVDTLLPWEQATVTGYDKNGEQVTQTFIIYKAAAYRTPEDERPGIGLAWEIWPGRTPYTRGSELMNAETSAWGRAIIAVLASDSKAGVASRQEVAARRAEREDGLPVNADGSLSRSRTSDAEKEQAGVMTGAQQAEHTALRPKAAEVRGKVSRATSPALDDPWLDQPAGSLPAGMITRAQQKKMHAAFAGLGITGRDERLEWTRQALGLDVLESLADLTQDQAATLLDALDREVAGA